MRVCDVWDRAEKAKHPSLAPVAPHHRGGFISIFFARFLSDNSCMVSIKMNFHWLTLSYWLQLVYLQMLRHTKPQKYPCQDSQIRGIKIGTYFDPFLVSTGKRLLKHVWLIQKINNPCEENKTLNWRQVFFWQPQWTLKLLNTDFSNSIKVLLETFVFTTETWQDVTVFSARYLVFLGRQKRWRWQLWDSGDGDWSGRLKQRSTDSW